MGELACELLKALQGKDCKLPGNAVAVTRQGVSVDLESVGNLYAQNRLGLPISDQFLRSVNPGRLMSRSKVYTPDFARRVK
jgi:regulator of sirC expression with transglutaminase-like and TPR domain